MNGTLLNRPPSCTSVHRRPFRCIGPWLLLLALLSCLLVGTNVRAEPAWPPVLAFYYMWYTPSTFCACHMSDLPVGPYDSGATATIDRQIRQASDAGINGFIGSWWGKADPTNLKFAHVLARAKALEHTIGRRFTSTIYLESDAPAFAAPGALANALRYVLNTYGSSPYFFHWHGKPVIFIWDPLGGGRTLETWAAIRQQIDSSHRSIWSAEGVDTNLLAVFDGLHLFSAAYWAVLDGTIVAADAGFRAKIDGYALAHGKRKIWAAGVLPGYDDTRVPGRQHPYSVPRDNGATYRKSWDAALASHSDWVTITSFNEWFEGAMIEPSTHYGNLYLNITRQYARD